MAANRCHNAVSRKAPELSFAEDEEGNSVLDSFEGPDEGTVPDKALDNAETGRMMNELIDGLPDSQRLCILLYYYDEMSVRDIAETLNVSENTVKSRLNYGRKAIKEGILRYEREEGIKLYSLAPMAALFRSLGQAVRSGIDPETAQAAAGRVLTAAGVAGTAAATAGTAAGTTAAAAAATGEAATAAGTVAGATAAGSAAATAAAVAAKGLPAKVIAAIVAGVLIVGGGLAAGLTLGNRPAEEAEPVVAEVPEEPEETPEEPVAEEPVVEEKPAEIPEEPAEPDLTELLCGTEAGWITNLDDGSSTDFVTGTTICGLTFAEDGTFTGYAGWYESESAGNLEGTYQIDGDQLTLQLRSTTAAYAGEPAGETQTSTTEYRVTEDGKYLLWEQLSDTGVTAMIGRGDRMLFVDAAALGDESDTPAAQSPAETPAAQAPATQTPASNVFYNENNSYYTVDTLSINPRYVYWDGGKLHAECFVVNGFNHAVYNINVKELSFSTDDGTLIASAAFGALENVTLPPYSNVIWTFVFNEDCVFSAGADLSALITNYSTSNSY